MILTINPGSTSIKVGLYQNEECIFQQTKEYEPQEMAISLQRQRSFLLQLLEAVLDRRMEKGRRLNAVVGRGGLLHPLKAGTYQVTERILQDLVEGVGGEHPANLGGILAYDLAEKYKAIPLVVDPVTVDEFHPIARISGHPRIIRKSLSHALNMKAVARRIAREEGRHYQELNLITAHLGGGISVASHQRGEMVDVNNANEQGPFSPERAGGLPILQLVDYCYQAFKGGRGANALKKELTQKSGLYGYLGTKDLTVLEKRRDERSTIILQAMAYQISKEIGAAAAVLKGEVDFIILTGGMAHSQFLTNDIEERISFIAPLWILPGENEMEALALGALRVLTGEEEVQIYRGKKDV